MPIHETQPFLKAGMQPMTDKSMFIYPGENGQIYWDCGNDGGGYDRINKQATEAEYEGTWQHWAFTKNATTGDMRIYLNGELWHTGTGKKQTN